MPYFSVIIPSFNAVAHIEKAIKSVLSQRFADFELLVMDGLSTDGTQAVVATFAELDGRVRFVSEKDKGIYDAMNKGISICKGKWIYFLGSDDSLYNAEVFEKVYRATTSDHLDFLYGDVLFQPSGKRYAGEFNYMKLLKKNICHQAIFYRKRIFEEIGLFNFHFRQHADWALNLAIFNTDGLQRVYLNEIVANFTTGSTSASHDRFFIKDHLLPEWVSCYNNPSIIPTNLKNFDSWWRMIRNSEIPWDEYMPTYFPQLPAAIKKIIRIQSAWPKKIIKTGIFSKLIMAVAFAIIEK